MKQFRILFAVVVMMMSSVAMAQTTVKGLLMDETLGESEPFATVRVFKAGKSEKPVAMFLTDENGQFSQEVKGKGRFDIVFSSIGGRQGHPESRHLIYKRERHHAERCGDCGTETIGEDGCGQDEL